MAWLNTGCLIDTVDLVLFRVNLDSSRPSFVFDIEGSILSPVAASIIIILELGIRAYCQNDFYLVGRFDGFSTGPAIGSPVAP